MNLKYGNLKYANWMLAAIVLLLCSMWGGTARAADRVLNNVSLSGPNPPSLGIVEVNQASTPVQLHADATTPDGEVILMVNGQPAPNSGFRFEWPKSAEITKKKFNAVTQNFEAIPGNEGTVTITPGGWGPQSNMAGLSASFPKSGTYQISFSVKGIWWAGTGDEFVGYSNPLTLTLNVKPPVLTLDSVTFGGSNYTIKRDTGSQSDYETPHWKKGRAFQSPVCYPRNSQIKASASFVVTPVGASQAVKIRASANSYLFPAQDVSLDNGTAAYSLSAANNNLPNTIRPGDQFNITWAYSTGDGVTWTAAGAGVTGATSSNQMYVTLGNSLTDQMYHTVLDVACRRSTGNSDASGAVNSIWKNFNSPASSVLTQDGRTMRYWPQGYFTPGNFTTQALVNTYKDDYNVDSSGGRCGAWSDFMANVLRVQGISARRWSIDPDIALLMDVPPQYKYLFATGLYVDTSHPGQGNVGPIVSDEDYDAFNNPIYGLPDHFASFAHAVVQIPNVSGAVLKSDGQPANGTVGTTIFDPSYGLFFSEANMDLSKQKWEDGSVTYLYAIYKSDDYTAPPYINKKAHTLGVKETSWMDSY